jgi:hypothetical protein
MKPQTLLVAKMTFVMLCLERIDRYFHDPFLPFIPALDLLGRIPGYGWLLTATFLIAGLLLMTNRHVRPACVVLGLVVLLINVQAQVDFRNHMVICGAVLLLAGLQPAGQEPWLIRWQMVIVYLGAWLNKQLDPDWLNGRFFEYWTHTNLQHPIYMKMAAWFPKGWLSVFMSWSTIASEFLVMVGLMNPRWWSKALWLGIGFHLATFVFMFGDTFGHFIQSLGVVYLVFLIWPETRAGVEASGRFARLIKSLDGNRTCDWSIGTNHRGLTWKRGGTIHRGIPALAEILRYHNGFYWCLLLIFEACVHFIPWPARFFVTLGLIVAAMFPFAWSALRGNRQ